MQIALSKYCGEKDIISRLHKDDLSELHRVGGRNRQNDQVPFSKYNINDWFQLIFRGRKQYFAEHLNLYNTKRWLGDEVWNSYFKFCVERNPIEKVLSYYFWRTRNGESSMEEFLDNYLESLSDYEIYGNQEGVQIDKVIKYEELNEGIALLEDKFGIPIDIASVQAKTKYRPSSEERSKLLKASQIERIQEAFHKEIKLFYPHLNTDSE